MKRLKKALDPTQVGSEAGRLASGLYQRIVGQDEAIHAVVSAYQMYLAARTVLADRSQLPVPGPTGSGKTKAGGSYRREPGGRCTGHDQDRLRRASAQHEIAKLIGSPPGYLGHRETHPLLSQEGLHQYHTEKMKLSFVYI